MEDVFKALVETNIPTLLTISGIVLLFLALAGRFGAYIEIKEERQKITLIAGVLLLITGIGLHVFPTTLEDDDSPVARGPSDDTPPKTQFSQRSFGYRPDPSGRRGVRKTSVKLCPTV